MVKDEYGRVVPQREPTEEEARVIRNLCRLGRTREMRKKLEFIKALLDSNQYNINDLALMDFWEKVKQEENVVDVAKYE